NVAMPLLLQKFPQQPPFRIVEIAGPPGVTDTAPALPTAAAEVRVTSGPERRAGTAAEASANAVR
ncbi:MAG: hypothetical protein JOZ12_10155, partial [Sinobacteraceae bacterium]|nr:hypothetical protein [Nevskiaceae bacterium]